MKPQKLKRVCIKEELVALTGHYITALILNQLIYWSERTADTDKFLEEELERNPDLDVEFLHGWIFKKAEELASELMIDVSAVTLRRYISKLVEQGLVQERTNPRQKRDRTLQYRPNIVEIQNQLLVLGYTLEGYSLDSLKPAPSLNLHFEGWVKPAPSLNLQNEGSNLQNEVSNLQNEVSTIYTEITSEITSETTAVAAATEQAFDKVFEPEKENWTVTLPSELQIENSATEATVIYQGTSSAAPDTEILKEIERAAFDWKLRPWMQSATEFKPEMKQAVWESNPDYYSHRGKRTPNHPHIFKTLRRLDNKLQRLDAAAIDAWHELIRYWQTAQVIANPHIEHAFVAAAAQSKKEVEEMERQVRVAQMTKSLEGLYPHD